MSKYPLIESDLSQGILTGGYVIRFDAKDNWQHVSKEGLESLIDQLKNVHVGFPVQEESAEDQS